MIVIYYLQKNINVKFPRITTEIGRNRIFLRRDKLGPEGKRGKGDRPQRHIYIREVEAKSAMIRKFRPRTFLLALGEFMT